MKKNELIDFLQRQVDFLQGKLDEALASVSSLTLANEKLQSTNEKLVATVDELPKQIASLESERKAHSKGIADSKFRYQTITHDIANNEAALERMKADWERYQSVVKRDKDGNPLNDLKIDSCNLSDEKNMGIHLQGLAQRTETHGHYQRIGEVYGFPILIISERTLVDGKESVQNRFVDELRTPLVPSLSAESYAIRKFWPLKLLILF